MWRAVHSSDWLRLNAALIVGLVIWSWAASSAFGQRAEPQPLVLPVPATFKLTAEGGGERLSGKVVRWTRASIMLRADGAAEDREIAWTAVDTRAAYDLRRKLMNQKDVVEWLDLAALMLYTGSETLAHQAFTKAESMESSAQTVAARLRSAKAKGQDPREELDRVLAEAAARDAKRAEPSNAPPPTSPRDGEEPNRPSPGGTERAPADGKAAPDDRRAARGAKPWPMPTPEERAEFIAESKAGFADVMKRLGHRLRLIESERWLLYHPVSDAEAGRWLARLDDAYEVMASVLGFDPGINIFHGKCAVFVQSDRNQFIEFELDMFENTNAARAGGICHMLTPDPIMCFFVGTDPQSFIEVLTHEATHAIMYRHRTPARIPTWANEGLADFIAGQITPNTNEPQTHWQHTLSFLRQKKDPLAITRQEYRDGSWPTSDSYPLSHMMVRYLVKTNTAGLSAWINDIKSGAEWSEAFQARFGKPLPDVIRDFTNDLLRERSYTKVVLRKK